MVKIKNDCPGCGQPCFFEACPHYRVEYYYCDKCGSEVNSSSELSATCWGKMVCGNCLKKNEEAA